MPDLLVAGAAGLVLGLLASVLGWAELRHRAGTGEAGGDTAEFPPILAEPRRRGRW